MEAHEVDAAMVRAFQGVRDGIRYVAAALVLIAVALVIGQCDARDAFAGVEVVGQAETMATLTQDVEAETWEDDYGVLSTINVSWRYLGLRVGLSSGLEEQGYIGSEAGVTIAPRSRVFAYAGVGLTRVSLPENEKATRVVYRGGVYRRLFTWDQTDFTIGGGIRLVDRDAPKADLQPWLSFGWLGR